MLEGPHSFHFSHCLDGCNLSCCLGKPKVNAMTDFRKTCHEGSYGHRYYSCCLSSPKCSYVILHLHICSDWLIKKKGKLS